MNLVYSSIYRDYDLLKEQPKQSVPTEFILYTDSNYETDTWKVIKEDREGKPLLQARYRKMNPPEGYEHTIWIDGSIQITNEKFVENIIKQFKDVPVMSQKHPHREDIFTEAYQAPSPRYDTKQCIEQVEVYRKEGYNQPGLFWSCIIARKGKTKEFNELWEQENKKWPALDQIAQPYVFWKLGWPIEYMETKDYEWIWHNRQFMEI